MRIDCPESSSVVPAQAGTQCLLLRMAKFDQPLSRWLLPENGTNALGPSLRRKRFSIAEWLVTTDLS